LLLKSGDSSIYVNSIQKATSANSLRNWNYTTGIGGGQYTSDNLDGTIQEIIFYTSDKSANRTGIEGNINDYYNIYP
jgi:hypothetical protein